MIPTIKDFTSAEDSELALATKASDAAAFKALYLRYYESITTFLYHRTLSMELTRDFAQEVFTRLWQNRDAIDETKSIKAYLYRIANNLTIDYFRKQGSRRSYLSAMALKDNKTTDDCIEVQTSINMAIQKLPERLRTVFILSRHEGLKYAEIADVCHISVKTVESRMSQALEFLRKELL